MRGYVVKKGNQYYAGIYEGTDPTTGEERRRWHPGGPLKREAERLVNELVKRKDDGTYRGPDRLTLGEYLTTPWLPAQVGQLSPSTYDSSRRNIDLYVIPCIGGVPLQKLAAEGPTGSSARVRSRTSWPLPAAGAERPGRSPPRAFRRSRSHLRSVRAAPHRMAARPSGPFRQPPAWRSPTALSPPTRRAPVG